MSDPLPPILIVEDDIENAHLIERVLRRARIVNPIETKHAGADADAYFDEAGPGKGNAVPVLVLLDLHLPQWDGLAFLERVRRDYDPQAVPIVILSGSAQPADIDRAFELGANSYLVKPVAFDALIDTLENLGLPRAILPPEAKSPRP